MRSLPDDPNRAQSQFRLLCAAVAVLACGLLGYSQTLAFAWDEGYHVLAAQLINAGKRPYLDFCFPQTPLNAYWVAGWMRIAGETWRAVHALAALETAAAILLIADYVYARFPVTLWRLVVALSAALLFGLNVPVFQYGTVGQAYGFCLLASVAAFRVAVEGVAKRRVWWSFAAGFLAAAAAASSLLTAPVAPVLLLWALIYNREGGRWVKFTGFLAGGLLAFLPVLMLAVRGFRPTLFSVLQYHLFYRGVEWEEATSHNIDVWLSWIDSADALLLGVLALAGLVFTIQREADRSRRGEMYLCFWLTAALTLHISTARPTFSRYYLLTVPFLAVLAAVGLYEVGSRLEDRKGPRWALLAVTILLCLALGKGLYDSRDNYSWPEFEQIAAKIDQVTPPGGLLFADEHIYFLTRRSPPSGMELQDSHKLSLPPDLAALVHVVPRSEWARRMQAGMFSTVQTCRDEDDQRFEVLGVPPLYRRNVSIDTCNVYWDLAAAPPAHH